jgi:TRAP-type C4-dicarboxylate transport system permease small subunit
MAVEHERLQGRRTTLQRLLWILDSLARIWLGALVLAVLLLMTGRALDRYFFHTTFDAYEQLAGVGVVWITFFGFALAFRDDRNLRVELLENILTERINRVRRVVFDLIVLGMALVLNIAGWPVFFVTDTQHIVGTPFTLAIASAAMQFSTILLCLLCVFRIVSGVMIILGLRAPEAAAPPHAAAPPL